MKTYALKWYVTGKALIRLRPAPVRPIISHPFHAVTIIGAGHPAQARLQS
jgi:hypothetical protein